MNFLFDLIPTLLVLGALILVHEFGHFIACRISKVRVEKFSIGFGPELFSIQGKETRYAISLFPFGGYVTPSGESASEIGEGGPRPGDYLAASVLKRIFIVTAGVAMNYLLTFVLFVAIFVAGRPVPLAQIGSLIEGYPAEQSGLKKGDRIISLDGMSVLSWEDLTGKLGTVTDSHVLMEIERGGETLTLSIPLKIDEVQDIFGKTHRVPRLGIVPDQEAQRIERLTILPAMKHSFLTEIRLTGMTYKALFYLTTGRLSLKTISGPIGIVAMTGSAAKMGLIYVLHLAAVLGISLAVINLLPIPALDGGHLLFLLIESLTRRRVSVELQERATQIGFALLMILMVFILYNDLVNLQVIDRFKSVLNR